MRTSRVSLWGRRVVAVYMAASAAAAVMILAIGVADAVSAGWRTIFETAMSFSVLVGLLAVVAFGLLLVGVIIVVVAETMAMYHKWARWAEDLAARG